MAGHGSSMAGILVEGGNFDWMQNDKFPTMTKPYEGYHGFHLLKNLARQLLQ